MSLISNSNPPLARRRKVSAWLIDRAQGVIFVSLGLFATALFLAIFLIFQTGNAEQSVGHTMEVRQTASELLGDLKDAETGQRGYLLTEDENYLEPYQRGTRDARSNLRQLRTLTSDNPQQQARLNELEPVIETKFNELQNTIALTRQGRRDQALERVKSDTGKALLDDIRQRLDQFSQAESNLLALRQLKAASLRGWLLAVVGFCIVVGLGLAFLLAQAAQILISDLRKRTSERDAELLLRRSAEDNFRRAQKMEALGQLTGGIAHDFNNLLTIIIGNLDTIQRRLKTPADDGRRLIEMIVKPLEFAIHGAQSAAQLTQRLLAFSRRQPLQPARLDLNRVISSMSELLRRTFGETVNVETVLAGGLWPTLADPAQLESALLNLAINAKHAMPNGGRLSIETANTYLDDSYCCDFPDVAPGQYVQLSVADTGTGIDAETIQKVFEPFFTTKGSEGSGLGLAMVHGFIKQSGGHIRIYSEVGHGTTVKIYLPRLMQADQFAAAPSARPSLSTIQEAYPQETILVVEDSSGVRQYAVTALAELGYQVLEAGDADEALRLLESTRRIDLLFTDVVLPGANGRELARQAILLRQNLPVLYTSGYTRNAIIHHGRLDAGLHLLNKPYTQSDLAKKIRELLDNKTK